MKIFALFLVLGLFGSTLSQNCNNPLLDVFNFPGLATPQSGANLPYCSNLQSGDTCCAPNIVSQFQNGINMVTQNLEQMAANRDRQIASLNQNYTSRFQTLFGQLSDTGYDDAINDITDRNADVGDEIRREMDRFGEINSALDNFDNDNNLLDTVVEYQNRRATCFTTLLTIQASAWCLACDPNYASQGVQADGTVNASQSLCDEIQSSCAPFLDQAVQLNPLFQAQQGYDRMNNIKDYLDEFRSTNALPNYTITNDIPIFTNAINRTVGQPEGCDGENCQWQCDNLFSPQFQLNDTIAANGAGEIGADDIAFPPVGVTAEPAPTPDGGEIGEDGIILNPEETIPGTNETISEITGNGRRLQAGEGWNPDLNDTGLNITVVSDPGNVTNAGSDVDINDNGGGGNTLSASKIAISGLVLAFTLTILAGFA